jgi:hypothetical protein
MRTVWTGASSGSPPWTGHVGVLGSACAARHGRASRYQAGLGRSVQVISEQAAAFPEAGVAATGWPASSQWVGSQRLPPGGLPAGIANARADLLDLRPRRCCQVRYGRGHRPGPLLHRASSRSGSGESGCGVRSVIGHGPIWRTTRICTAPILPPLSAGDAQAVSCRVGIFWRMRAAGQDHVERTAVTGGVRARACP